MEEYYNHDLDFPWRLHFNGELMPRWANGWSLCDLLPKVRELIGEKQQFAGYNEICSLHHRLDLAHSIESEDPEVFRIVCLTLLSLLMRQEEVMLQEITTAINGNLPDFVDQSSIANAQVRPVGAAFFGTSAQTIFNGIRDGLISMHRLAERDKMAVWTVGYDADRLALKEAIRRSRLSLTHAEHLELPHLQAKPDEVSERARLLRADLVRLLSTTKADKTVRSFIHQLPTSL